MRRPSFRVRHVVLFALAAALCALVVVGCAGVCRPAWYQPASINFEQLPQDKQALVGLLEKIGQALNHDRPCEFQLDAAQINRWIAARFEMPEAERWFVEGIRNPLVDLRPSGLHIASMIDTGVLEVVASCALDFTVAPDRLTIRVASVRVGRLPVPVSWVARAWTAAVSMTGDGPAGEANGTLSLPNKFVWKNGKKPYRVSVVEFGESTVRVRLEPL